MSVDARLSRGRKPFDMLVVISRVFVLAGLLVPTHVRAASYATAYDMNMFLNQPHPFDLGAVQQPYSAVGTTLDTPVGAPAMDDDDEMDGLGDLVADDEEGTGDPLEPINRFIFGFNSIVNDIILSPLARGYNSVVPDFARESISSFLGNLSSPVVLANDLMQLEFGRAYRTAERTLINTTIGIGGIWDAASWMGVDPHKEDFGPTLGAYGVG